MEAAFCTVPEEIVGEIYALLDGASRQNFRLSCQAVRAAPSVLHQISRAQVVLTPQRLCHSHPLKDWPRGAKLRSLQVGATRPVGQTKQMEDDGHQLLGLLQPQHPGTRSKVTSMLQDLRELTLTRVVVQSGILASLLGELMASLPCLKVLRIIGKSSSAQLPINPSMFDALSDRACTLVELDLSEAAGVTGDVLQAVSRIQSLQKLSLDISCLDTSFSPAQPAVFGSLQRLEVSGLAENGQACLNTLLAFAARLKCLVFKDSLALDDCSSLPSSLKEIHAGAADADALNRILHGMISKGLLPSLQLLRIGQLCMQPSISETDHRSGNRSQITGLNAELEWLISGILATTYKCWPCNPGQSIQIQAEIIEDIQNFMAFMILCAALGPGASHVRVIRTLDVSTRNMGFQILAKYCPNLTSVSVCIQEVELEVFFDAVQHLPQLEHLQVVVSALPLGTGFSATLVALCSTAAMAIKRDRPLFLTVVVGQKACALPEDDDDVVNWLDQARDEVDAFYHAWALAMLRLLPNMKTKIIPEIVC